MRNIIEAFKREYKPLLIAYVIFDVIFIGTLASVAKWSVLNDKSILEGILEQFMTQLTSFGFFGGIFGNFGFFLKDHFGRY